MGGQFWVGGYWWGSATVVSFFRDVCGLNLGDQYNARAAAYRATAESACWWWPHRDFVVVSERPSAIHRDAAGRLHCETGPAIAWRGFAIYAWHGTRIPADWIEHRATLDPTTAITWRNIEQRRAAAEILGWDKILSALDAKVIDQDPDPEIGTLLRVDLPDAPGSQFLRVRCGTGRTFALPVPTEIKTARRANQWTYSLEEVNYQPEVRT